MKNGTCHKIAAVSPVLQSVFFGKTVCGLRGGSTFKEAIRANKKGSCPAGYMACSNSTSPENTICYSLKDNSKNACPITALFFVENSKVDTYIKNGYESGGLIGDKVLVYSKSANGLPISTTHVGLLPCMNPVDVQTTRLSEFYVLEVQQP